MRITVFIMLLICLSCSDASMFSAEIASLKNQVSELQKESAMNQVDQSAFIHTVFFWIKDGVSEQDKMNFAKSGLGELLSCKSIYKGYYGPSAQSSREVVDTSYDFALVCHFKSDEDHEIYQKDPQHLAFIESYKHLWERVQVYDNLVNK